MDGLMTGTIKSGSDKEHPGMLEVSIPDTKNKTASTCWAQVLTPYAGNGYGVFFLPEVGDHVVVAFPGGSETPVVLGCLYGAKDKLPAGADGGVTKEIRTKGGHSITFTDGGDKSGLTVKTKDGCSVVLSDSDKSVEILARDKVSIKAGKIILDGETVITGPTVKIDAKSSVTIKAPTLEAKGAASASLESGGVLNIKGALTKINS